MRRLAVVPLMLLASALAEAQPGATPAGLVVGSGNFFSPIVASLDEAVAFYRDGLGLTVQGQPGDAAQNPALRAMFGLPDAKIRWAIARPPATMGGVEIIEITDAGGKPLARNMQDPGAFTLLVIVRDMDSVLARLKELGTPIVSATGAPASVPMGANAPPARMVMVRDPDGHFVEIVQPGELPAADSAPPPNVIEVRVRLTVADVPRALQLFRDTLGMEPMSESQFTSNPTVAGALGVPGARFRFGMLRIPTSGIVFEVIEFADLERQTVLGRIQDPGSTRIQLRVRDIDATIAALAPFGGTVISTGGKALDLPAGNNKLRVAIVREPDNLFLVLIESPPPG
jgi:catechol 2,3-dioxygenase-like lactoylglutathione lyase family enzyme